MERTKGIPGHLREEMGPGRQATDGGELAEGFSHSSAHLTTGVYGAGGPAWLWGQGGQDWDSWGCFSDACLFGGDREGASLVAPCVPSLAMASVSLQVNNSTELQPRCKI